jgi:hypothetical protein
MQACWLKNRAIDIFQVGFPATLNVEDWGNQMRAWCKLPALQMTKPRRQKRARHSKRREQGGNVMFRVATVKHTICLYLFDFMRIN